MIDLTEDGEMNAVNRAHERLKEKFGSWIPKPNSHWLYLGLTDSGKTIAMLSYLTTFLQDVYDRIVLFSPHPEYDIYERWLSLPPNDIKKDLSRESIQSLVSELKAEWERSGKTSLSLIIFDDQASKISHGSELTKDFADLTSSCRHFGIGLIFMAQTPKMLGSKARSNITAVSSTPNYVDRGTIKNAFEGITYFPVSKPKTSKSKEPSLEEIMTAGRELNKERDDKYGRILMIRNVNQPLYTYTEVVERDLPTLQKKADGVEVEETRKVRVFETKINEIVLEADPVPQKRRGRPPRIPRENQLVPSGPSAS